MFEYYVRLLPYSTHKNDEQHQLNILGSRNWELVSVIAQRGQVVYYFKRRIQ